MYQIRALHKNLGRLKLSTSLTTTHRHPHCHLDAECTTTVPLKHLNPKTRSPNRELTSLNTKSDQALCNFTKIFATTPGPNP